LTKETLSNLLQESRRFDPPPELAAQANVTAGVYAEAARDRLAFWADTAQRLTWDEPWDSRDWSPDCSRAVAWPPAPRHRRNYARGMPPGIMSLYGACLAGHDSRGR